MRTMPSRRIGNGWCRPSAELGPGVRNDQQEGAERPPFPADPWPKAHPAGPEARGFLGSWFYSGFSSASTVVPLELAFTLFTRPKTFSNISERGEAWSLSLGL